MQETTGSRRTFLAGGAVAAAALAPLAIAAAREEGDGPLWRPRAPEGRPGEVAQWQSGVGAWFLIQGESGSVAALLSAVFEPPADLDRPARLARQHPFTLYFELDSRLAPEGQRTYRVARPDGASLALFLGRGKDAHGKAVLHAIFN